MVIATSLSLYFLFTDDAEEGLYLNVHPLNRHLNEHFQHKKERPGVLRVSVAVDGIFKNSRFVVCLLSSKSNDSVLPNQKTAVFQQFELVCHCSQKKVKLQSRLIILIICCFTAFCDQVQEGAT